MPSQYAAWCRRKLVKRLKVDIELQQEVRRRGDLTLATGCPIGTEMDRIYCRNPGADHTSICFKWSFPTLSIPIHVSRGMNTIAPARANCTLSPSVTLPVPLWMKISSSAWG